MKFSQNTKYYGAKIYYIDFTEKSKFRVFGQFWLQTTQVLLPN